MTATDELRRLLDERGIEYEPIDSVHSPNRRTLWGKAERSKGVFGMCFKYETIEFKKGMRLTISDCSPEQAVEATLGRGMCRLGIERTFERIDGDEEHLLECSECGSRRWWLAHMMPRYCPDCGRKVIG